MRRSRGFKNKTRRLLRHKERTTITQRMREFSVGDPVVIKINSSISKGCPHPRYYGVFGRVIEERGRAYVIAIKDKNKKKEIISAREHLIPITIPNQKE
ncbi:MAG: 50S ribosomal protein L21e [Candidatus Aenigmarchaeota archaeon]|nr:50S ribosomal protein L21e [Candidatus Aenigmarchaeota archaeon]MCK5176575.1 50S ribosomal protein L21e [Candidatus Aenigmarchaeota archaeon]